MRRTAHIAARAGQTLRGAIVAAGLLASACGSDAADGSASNDALPVSAGDSGAAGDTSAAPDAGNGRDSGVGHGTGSDAGEGPVDSGGTQWDAGPADTGGWPVDAGSPPDTGSTDAGEWSEDGGSPPWDSGSPPVDAGEGPVDAGTPPDDTGAPPEDTWTPPPGPGLGWDGSFKPADADYPLAGLYDDEYYDGHVNWDGEVSPILPPGQWDWDDDNDDLANWHNFEGAIGRFEPLLDGLGRHYGWELVGNVPDKVPFSGPAAYFEGSPGIDVLNLGANGHLSSYTTGDLGDGPDVLVFDAAWSLDFRTGSSLSGSKWDNDLVVGGCKPESGPSYQFKQATIHTGPGSDLVFARDMIAAAVDLGNGKGGLTAELDPNDGDDTLVLRGNMGDFRVFGGMGDDTAIWYADEGQESIAFYGPNFFGGGGSGDAIWGDPGTDRLVMVVPLDTTITDKTPTPPGGLLVRLVGDYEADIWWDAPVYDDLYARYCITCGVGPGGRKTVTLEYKAKSGPVFTGYFWITAIEELQIGLGPDAVVYRVDDVNGKLLPAPDLTPVSAPAPPPWACK